MGCNSCQDQLKDYLSAVPSAWRDQLISLLCKIKEDKQKPECQDVRDCETLTSVEGFFIDGTVAGLRYTDEHSNSYTREFDVSLILNNLMNETDPGCLSSEEDWLNLDFVGKFQAIIDAHCNCCS